MISFQNILVIQTSFIGDVILSTAAIESLHERHPKAQIDVVVRKGCESLFESHPFIRKVYAWDKHKGKYLGLIQLGLELRRRGYDLCINLHRFASSGLLTVFSRADHKAGFSKNPLSIFYNHSVEHQFDGQHEIERNFQVISPYTSLENSKLPRLYPTEADEEKSRQLVQGSFYCIAPSSVWFTKQWPAEKWSELCSKLPHNEKIYLLGGPDDYQHNQRIVEASNHPSITNLAGKLTLLQSAALMAKAVMNYVNDSAPLHLCSAMNAPVRVLYCSTVPSFGFGPLSENSKVIETRDTLDCRPCGIHGYNTCPKGHFKCAHTITTQQVLADA